MRGLRREPELLLEPLAERMRALAAEQRFEEAADVRERAAALSLALRRQRRFDALLGAGRLVVEVPGAGGAELHHGRLARAWPLAAPSGASGTGTSHGHDAPRLALVEPTPALADAPTGPPTRELADELWSVAAWLDRHAHEVRLVDASGGLASTLPPLPDFEPARSPHRRPGADRSGG